MKVLVTGGSGFIGSCLVNRLNKAGIKDIVIVDHLGSSEKWKNLLHKDFEDYIERDDFIEYVRHNKLRKEYDFIIHFGACTSTIETDAAYMMKNNYAYSKELAKWALANNMRFIYASSAATYGDGSHGYSDENKNTLTLSPLNIYGYSKHLFDLWVIKNELSNKVTGFKFFNVFGPNEYHKAQMKSVIAKVFAQVAGGEPFRLFKSYDKKYGQGEQKRDFVYVKDVVEVVYYFIEHPGKKGIFNIGTGEARSWNDLAAALFSSLRKKPLIEYVDMPESLRQKYQYFTQADLKKLRKAGCAHKFLSLEEAIKDYTRYLKNHAYL